VFEIPLELCWVLEILIVYVLVISLFSVLGRNDKKLFVFIFFFFFFFFFFFIDFGFIILRNRERKTNVENKRQK